MDMDRLFIANYQHLLAWCARHTDRRYGDPEDHVHQAYLRCRRSWIAAKQSTAHPVAYFYRALRWVVSDTRRRCRERSLTGEFAVLSTAGAAAPEASWLGEEWLARLSPRERQICEGYLRGLTDEELHKSMQLSRQAVAVHRARAYRKLRRRLQETWE